MRGQPWASLLPCRRPPARLLLLVVVLIPVFNTIFFMTIAFQYLYGLSVWVQRWPRFPHRPRPRSVRGSSPRRSCAPGGTHRTAVLLLLFLIPSLLTGFAVNAESPCGS